MDQTGQTFDSSSNYTCGESGRFHMARSQDMTVGRQRIGR